MSGHRILEYPLQKLIVTPGWYVGYHAFYAVDPTPQLVTNREAFWWFKQDIYQARHNDKDRLIDLGWYAEGDWDNGQYGLVLYAGDFRGELLRDLRTKDRKLVVEWFKAVSNGEL